MTLTERKLNPEITAVPARTLTDPEMEQAAGGDYNRKLIILCDQLGIHDFVFTGNTSMWSTRCAATTGASLFRGTGQKEKAGDIMSVGTGPAPESGEPAAQTIVRRDPAACSGASPLSAGSCSATGDSAAGS